MPRTWNADSSEALENYLMNKHISFRSKGCEAFSFIGNGLRIFWKEIAQRQVEAQSGLSLPSKSPCPDIE